MPEALQMRCHPRDKVEMCHVPVITPAPIPFKPEHSNAALRQKLCMVVVLPRTSSFTKSSTTTKLVEFALAFRVTGVIIKRRVCTTSHPYLKFKTQSVTTLNQNKHSTAYSYPKPLMSDDWRPSCDVTVTRSCLV